MYDIVILAYVITYFRQAKTYCGQVKNHELLARRCKLVLKLMLVPVKRKVAALTIMLLVANSANKNSWLKMMQLS